MPVKLFAYDNASESSKLLATALGIKRLRHEGSKWTSRRGRDKIINWGHSGDKLNSHDCLILNEPDKVAIASNKLKFFNTITAYNKANPNNVVNIPEYTTDTATAVEWAKEREVLCRTVLNGHSGEGITLANLPTEVIAAPLYVKYIPKKYEFRVHVMGREVFDVARKIKDPNREVTSFYIRNHAAGFIFARNDIEVPSQVIEQAIRAIDAIGLDFGAVDIIYNKKRETAYVLEINSAPGLQGATVTNYAEAFSKLLEV